MKRRKWYHLDRIFHKTDISDSDEGETSSEYAHKVCTMNPVPWNKILKFPDLNAVKEPMLKKSVVYSLPDCEVMHLGILEWWSQYSLEPIVSHSEGYYRLICTQ